MNRRTSGGFFGRQQVRTASSQLAYLRDCPAQPAPRAVRAFSLVELLVVIGIVAVLTAVMLTAVRRVRDEAHTLQCTSNMRNIAMRFQLFATRQNAKGQGDSERLGPNRFFINDFQDMLYRLDEFWDLGPRRSGVLDRAKEITLCPTARGSLTKRDGFPCGRRALQPPEAVSVAMNMRLYRGKLKIGGSMVLAPTSLTRLRPNILDHPFVPLAMDVDAAAATAARHDPFYIAPPTTKRNDPYASGRYWFPSDRHHGKTVVAFVGGHVLSSRSPANEAWDWDYSARVGR